MPSRIVRLFALVLAACSVGCGPQKVDVTPAPSHAPATAVPTGTPSPVPASPTATQTLRPAPTVFTEEFVAKPSYWSFLQIDNGQSFAGPSLRDGFLVFDLTAANQWAYAIYGGHTYANAMVEAQVQDRTGGGDGATGLICRYDEQQGWYEFNIYSDQTYQLLFGQWLAQGVARYTPMYQSTSEQIQIGSNQISLTCQGNALTPFINGVQLRTWQDLKFGLKTGKVGLAASSFEDAPFTAAFDWVKVSLP